MAWNKPITRGADGGARRKSGTLISAKGVVAALVVVFGAFAAWLFIGGNTPDKPQRRIPDRKAIKNATPSLPRSEEPVRETAQPQPVPVSNATDRARNIWQGKEVRSWTTVTNGQRIVESIVTSDGKLHRVISDYNPDGFTSSTDQIFAMVVGGDDDGPAAPTPALSNGKSLDREFRASLEKPIVINDDDSETVRAIKERVAAARAEMIEMIDGGSSFAEVIEEARKIKNENFETRTKAIDEYREILRSGDKEGASEYLFKINLALQQMGIKEIPEEGESEE